MRNISGVFTARKAALDRYTQMRERENIIFKFNIKD